MPRGSYRLSDRAQDDLAGIADELGKHSIIAADSVLDELRQTFKLLAASPEIGEMRYDLREGLRAFVPAKPASNYVVLYYRIATSAIEVSDVIHAARDWIGMFERGER
jgi:plasmid stabilization system protein ParE